MSMNDLIVRRSGGDVPAIRRADDDLFSLQRGVNRLFDDFLDDFGIAPLSGAEDRPTVFIPRADIAETDKEIKVSVELPGLDEKDVEVTLNEEALTVRGEKKEEHEERTEQSYRVERSYGSFHRVLPLPVRVEAGKAKAVFKKGVLHVALPKAAGTAARGRRIEIETQ